LFGCGLTDNMAPRVQASAGYRTSYRQPFVVPPMLHSQSLWLSSLDRDLLGRIVIRRAQLALAEGNPGHVQEPDKLAHYSAF
jgi:hypothetical protein